MPATIRSRVTPTYCRFPAANSYRIILNDIPVSHIQIEKNLIRISSYDVILTDGTNVEFNHKGEWKEIKRHGLPIPPAIIPEVIQDLIKKNYSSNKVVKIEKEIRDYEIKLDNGLEMTFDLKGNLIDIDD